MPTPTTCGGYVERGNVLRLTTRVGSINGAAVAVVFCTQNIAALCTGHGTLHLCIPTGDSSSPTAYRRPAGQGHLSCYLSVPYLLLSKSKTTCLVGECHVQALKAKEAHDTAGATTGSTQEITTSATLYCK